MTPEKANKAIVSGQAPSKLIVKGSLSISQKISHLPDFLEVEDLHIYSGEALEHFPQQLRCRSLLLKHTKKLTTITGDIRVHDFMQISRCENLTGLSGKLHIKRLEIGHCPKLQHLPAELRLKELEIQQCPSLTTLPAGLKLQTLKIKSCKITLPADLEVSDFCKFQACDIATIPPNLHVRTFIFTDSTKKVHIAPEMTVSEHLDLHGNPHLRQLWSGVAQRLHSLNLSGCTELTALPEGLQVDGRLDVSNCPNLQALPASLHKLIELNVSGCTALTELPPDLEVHTLNASGCTNLRSLPKQLRATVLNISHCSRLTSWPENGIPSLKRLNMRGCRGLTSLPPGNVEFDQLDIGDCPQITRLPDALFIGNWIDVANMPAHLLPFSGKGYKLRWHGVQIPGIIAFHPELLTVHQILNESNIELRRIMIERIGIERFLQEANPTVIHTDTDVGGHRQLLCIELQNDEPLVGLQVQDPSTGRQYLIRVPPTMRTCHQAAAWIAGFDNPADYHPIAET